MNPNIQLETKEDPTWMTFDNIRKKEQQVPDPEQFVIPTAITEKDGVITVELETVEDGNPHGMKVGDLNLEGIVPAPLLAIQEALSDSATLENPLNKAVALEAQSFVAQKLLADKGWDIVKQLFLISSEMLQTTQLFVLPVISEEDLVKEKLGENYEEFQKGFDALKEDLATMSSVLIALSKKHVDKVGAVEPEDQTLVAELTMGYSNIQSQMENEVGPELMKQMAILEAAGVSAEDLFAAFVAGQEEPEKQ